MKRYYVVTKGNFVGITSNYGEFKYWTNTEDSEYKIFYNRIRALSWLNRCKHKRSDNIVDTQKRTNVKLCSIAYKDRTKVDGVPTPFTYYNVSNKYTLTIKNYIDANVNKSLCISQVLHKGLSRTYYDNSCSYTSDILEFGFETLYNLLLRANQYGYKILEVNVNSDYIYHMFAKDRYKTYLKSFGLSLNGYIKYIQSLYKIDNLLRTENMKLRVTRNKSYSVTTNSKLAESLINLGLHDSGFIKLKKNEYNKLLKKLPYNLERRKLC